MENNCAYLLRTEITKSHLINRICQHCGVKTSMVTSSFYYVFNISLSCNINIPSFIGNLWWVLLPGNHLKCPQSSKILLCYLILYLTQWTSAKENLDEMQCFWEVLKTFKFQICHHFGPPFAPVFPSFWMNCDVD